MARLRVVPLVVAVLILCPSNRCFASGAEQADFRVLMDCVQSSPECREQVKVFQDFSARDDAPDAIPALVDALDEQAPKLDNNACLVMDMIAANHPSAEIPLEPLVAAIQRKIWTSQQKCAQALEKGLTPEFIRENQVRLVRVLIPLLLSQRSRVFEAGWRCLEKVTGESHGPSPDWWLEYYERRFGEPLSLEDSFYEWVAVIDRLPGGGYRIDGEEFGSDSALVDHLRGLQGQLDPAGLALQVVVRATEEEIKGMFAGPGSTSDLASLGDLGSMIQLLMVENSIPVTFSPPQDLFRPPHSILRSRLSQRD